MIEKFFFNGLENLLLYIAFLFAPELYHAAMECCVIMAESIVSSFPLLMKSITVTLVFFLNILFYFSSQKLDFYNFRASAIVDTRNIIFIGLSHLRDFLTRNL